MTFLPRAAPRFSSTRIHHYANPLLLIGLAFFVFKEGSTHKFTNWDDWKYIVENPLVQGFSIERVWTAFTQFHVFNYNPLHIVSYMVDFEIWGLRGGGFFLTSLLLHAGTAVLFYYFVLRLLDSRGAALFMAAVFLVHPTRVESVAWLSERKDVLSGLFTAAALLSYTKHLDAMVVRRSGQDLCPALSGSKMNGDHLHVILAWVFFLLALLSKSQLVTLPLIFVAMDICRRRPVKSAILSKVPFYALSIGFAWLTILAHGDESSRGIQFPDSFLAPLAALPRYLAHVLWPFRLSPYYEFASGAFQSPAFVASGAGLLLLLLASAWHSLRGDRVIFLGVVWFLAFLAPVMGFVRINISLADRYLYLAIIGPLLPLSAIALKSRELRFALSSFAFAAVVVLSWACMSYLPVFRDTESLWSRVLDICPGCSMAHSNLGSHHRMQGNIAEAVKHYDADLAERPFFEESLLGRAILHEAAEENKDARRLYGTLLEKRPQSAAARVELADFLQRTGEVEKALGILEALDPAHATPIYYCKLSDVLLALKRPADALRFARLAVELDPYEPLARALVGAAESALVGPMDETSGTQAR